MKAELQTRNKKSKTTPHPSAQALRTPHSNAPHIIIKMNSLVDPRIIKALYRASQAGVKVDLIIRGICCLRPGVPGVSENITVRSIIDRYLEHSRIFYFHNDGNEEIYCGSADWMPRNFFRRIETVFPVLDQDLKKRLRDEILGICLRDNTKARLMKSDGCYARVRRRANAKPCRAQEWLMQKAEEEKQTDECEISSGAAQRDARNRCGTKIAPASDQYRARFRRRPRRNRQRSGFAISQAIFGK